MIVENVKICVVCTTAKWKLRSSLCYLDFSHYFCWSLIITLYFICNHIRNESENPEALTLFSLILLLFLLSGFLDSTLNKSPYHASLVGYTVSLTELGTSGTCLAPVLLSYSLVEFLFSLSAWGQGHLVCITRARHADWIWCGPGQSGTRLTLNIALFWPVNMGIPVSWKIIH